ncbi:hypothetical protein KZP23_14110 [Echinicola marina]|uniref:hypothetical protein n=1 Tax=Echinicola marina TaxID=2859768 RepID=UPI001CF63A2A|nr:hypothetical protein [Echinicola marina]UCS91863.1 hypothetical protein KZP23_14110 [Echinicola marina]
MAGQIGIQSGVGVNLNLNGDILTNCYALGEHWRSDLAFYKDELRFLKELLGKYFYRFMEDIDLNHVRRIENRLMILDRRREEVDFKIDRQMKAISEHLKSGNKSASHLIISSHEELEHLLNLLAKDFRKLKRTIFRLVEDGLDAFQPEEGRE